MLWLKRAHLFVTLLLVAPAAPGFAATFSDGTFNLSDYSQTTYGNNLAGAGVSATVTQSTSLGNPPPSQQVRLM